MLERYEPNFAALTPEQALYLASAIERRTPSFPSAEGGEYESGLELMHHADAYNLDQADVVMSLASDPTPLGVEIIETLIRPHEIQRIAPKRTSSRTPRKNVSRSRTSRSDPRIIHLQSESNPKKEGTKAYDLWERYRDGMTVSEFCRAGGTTAAVRYDEARGFITLTAPETK